MNPRDLCPRLRVKFAPLSTKLSKAWPGLFKSFLRNRTIAIIHSLITSSESDPIATISRKTTPTILSSGRRFLIAVIILLPPFNTSCSNVSTARPEKNNFCLKSKVESISNITILVYHWKNFIVHLKYFGY